MRDRGFTLIELLVVLAILGVTLGILIGRGPMRSRGLELRAAAGALAQECRAARARAIATDRDVLVSIDPARRLFGEQGRGEALLAPGLDVTVPESALRGPGSVRLIRFSPDGSSSGGALVLRRDSRRIAVAIEWLTGRVSVADAP